MQESVSTPPAAVAVRTNVLSVSVNLSRCRERASRLKRSVVLAAAAAPDRPTDSSVNEMMCVYNCI